jgi:hypothetical protein
LLFTHWVQASGVSVAPSKPHGYWRWLDHTITYLNFKKEMWVKSSSKTSGMVILRYLCISKTQFV